MTESDAHKRLRALESDLARLTERFEAFRASSIEKMHAMATDLNSIEDISRKAVETNRRLADIQKSQEARIASLTRDRRDAMLAGVRWFAGVIGTIVAATALYWLLDK